MERVVTEAGPRSTPEALARELRHRLDGVTRIEPVALAELFGSTFQISAHGHAVYNTLQAFLVQRTIDHARAHVAFYREREAYAEPIATEPGGRAWLGSLPSIDRAIVRDDHSDFIADDVQLRSVCHTSGTTGNPLEIYKSFEEVAFIGAFFSRLFAPGISAGKKTLSLTLPTPHHGVPVPFPSTGIVFASGVTDDTLIRDAHRVLGTDYLVQGEQRRISRMSGMGFQLLFFTNYLLEQGVDPAGFGLGGISVAGGFVPRHWRDFLARTWGCRINDRYSLTESAGGATRCPVCNVFRPDPQVLFEVVDIDSGLPTDSGIGKLLVTNLYPFAQMMPLIRYETGDVVRLGKCRCIGATGFEFLGRLANCVSVGSGADRRWLIFTAQLYDLFAELPDFNMYEWFSNVRAAKDRTVGSPPIAALQHHIDDDGKIRIGLQVELRYSPYTHRERVDELRRRLTDGLAACADTALAEGLAQEWATLDIEFLPPGGFEHDYIIKI